MPKGRCPKCGFEYGGWALHSPHHQTCPKCGEALIITDSEGAIFQGYSPFEAESVKGGLKFPTLVGTRVANCLPIIASPPQFFLRRGDRGCNCTCLELIEPITLELLVRSGGITGGLSLKGKEGSGVIAGIFMICCCSPHHETGLVNLPALWFALFSSLAGLVSRLGSGVSLRCA